MTVIRFHSSLRKIHDEVYGKVRDLLGDLEYTDSYICLYETFFFTVTKMNRVPFITLHTIIIL